MFENWTSSRAIDSWSGLARIYDRAGGEGESEADSLYRSLGCRRFTALRSVSRCRWRVRVCLEVRWSLSGSLNYDFNAI